VQAALWSAALAAGGCQIAAPEAAPQRPRPEQRRAERDRLQAEIERLQAQAARQAEQIQTLQGLGPKRLDRLVRVEKIDIGRYTAGRDTDGKPGHDAVRVYLRPLDADGHVLKAAGDVRIQLFDLAADAGRLLAAHDFGVATIRKHWADGMLARHYAFDCPWAAGPPAHPDVTVRVTFTDYLTGKTFTAQKLCQVALPPTTQSAR